MADNNRKAQIYPTGQKPRYSVEEWKQIEKEREERTDKALETLGNMMLPSTWLDGVKQHVLQGEPMKESTKLAVDLVPLGVGVAKGVYNLGKKILPRLVTKTKDVPKKMIYKPISTKKEPLTDERVNRMKNSLTEYYNNYVFPNWQKNNIKVTEKTKNKIFDRLNSVKYGEVDFPKDGNQSAEYYSSINQIYFPNNIPISNETILHELIHSTDAAIPKKVIRENKKLKSKDLTWVKFVDMEDPDEIRAYTYINRLNRKEIDDFLNYLDSDEYLKSNKTLTEVLEEKKTSQNLFGLVLGYNGNTKAIRKSLDKVLLPPILIPPIIKSNNDEK